MADEKRNHNVNGRTRGNHGARKRRRAYPSLKLVRFVPHLAVLSLLISAALVAFAVPWGSIFVPGEENWLALVRDPHHLVFEALTGIGQTLVINVLILAVVWPAIRRHIHRDVEHGVERDVEAMSLTGRTRPFDPPTQNVPVRPAGAGSNTERRRTGAARAGERPKLP